MIGNYNLKRVFRSACLVVAVAATMAAAAVIALLAWPMEPERYFEVRSSGEMLDRRGRLLCAFLNEDEQWCFARNIDEISPYLVQATVAAEDQRFWRHFGLDPLAAVRAAWQNFREGKVVSGASTLTMQVVKQADGPSQSLWAKVCQALQAIRLEYRKDKREILRAYLNTAPYGLNLVGCEAAARRFFGKPARELTLSEAALLAGLPKAPTTFMPLDHPKQARARRNYVLKRMREEGYLSEEVYRRACAEPLGVKWHEFPALARHLAMRLKPLIPDGTKLVTTLDEDAQKKAERLIKTVPRNYLGEITNAAMIVVDVESASVLAHVGSTDFFSTPGGGQVDATRAARSPGSALKPFTYALAMERQCLYPGEMLYDGTADYGLYNPENYDGEFRGLIPAQYALRRSLNVPAVTVLGRVGVEHVYELLRNLGLTTLEQPPDHYGLGLTLGNCEARLEELAAAYCALANLGEYRPLRTLAEGPPAPAIRVLSSGVCLALWQMLEQPLPEEFDRNMVQTAVSPRVCWKTGTSTGHHDASAFVFNRHYLVGVWLGNNDARPSKWLVGAWTALPLAGRMIRLLEPKRTSAWPEAGDHLREVKVCSVSGLPASRWCPHTRTALIPREQYLHRRCDMHYPARVAAGEGPASIVERWPASANSWDLAKIVQPVSAPEKSTPDQAKRIQALRILEPCDQARYVLSGETRGDLVKLRTSVDAEAALHWFLDDRYLGVSAPDRPLLMALRPGEHKLACMVASGATDTAHFHVDPPHTVTHFKN